VTEPMTRRRQRAAATAEQLLSAARGVFESKGYRAATVGAITEAANTAHGTFYLYFRNKEDAFGKVMAEVIEELYRQAGASWSGDPRATLTAAMRGFLDVYRAHRGLWRCVLEGMHQSERVERLWLDLRRPFVERIARNLARLVEAGEIRPMNTAVAAHALGSMVEWFAFAHFELEEPAPSDVSLDAVVETLADLWHHAVYGVTPH